MNNDGQIVTFYSFKGGVGRTMALANVAVRLAQRERRVLVVDFDLEAPGLHRYFSHAKLPSSQAWEGVLELLLEWITCGSDARPWWKLLTTVSVPGGRSLAMLPAGRLDGDYYRKVTAFDWDRLFDAHDGASRLEQLRDEWKAQYDFVLIDSRTGITDLGGVCTVILPDIIVPVFTTTNQSIDGVCDIIERTQLARQHYDLDRPPASILPLLSRFDGRVQYEESQRWLEKIAQRMEFAYAEWLPDRCSRLEFLGRTKIPYVGYFSFGEQLPILSQRSLADPESIGYAYNTIAALISHRLQNADQLLGDRDEYVAVTKPHQFDAMLSYQRRDAVFVRQLANELETRGVRLWIDDNQIMPGMLVHQAVADGIQSASSVIVCVGEGGISLSQQKEIAEAISLRAKIIPALLPGASYDDISGTLKGFAAVNLGDGLSELAIERLVWGITGLPQRTKSAHKQHTDGLRLLHVALESPALDTYTVLSLGREQRVIQDAIDSSPFRGRMSQTYAHVSTFDNLYQLIVTCDPQILQLSGHGDTEEIYLDSDLQGPLRITPELLNRVLQAAAPNLLVAIVGTSASRAFVSRLSVPVVIGFHENLSNDEAVEFSKFFYTALGSGHSVQRSYEIGRTAMELSSPGGSNGVVLHSVGGSDLSALHLIRE